MISWQVANVPCVVEILVDVLISTFITLPESGTAKHALSVDRVHILVSLIHSHWWLSTSQKVVVDLLVWVDTSIMLIRSFLKLGWLSHWELLLAQVSVIWLSLWRLLGWYFGWRLLVSWGVIHLLRGTGTFVIVSGWLVIVIFSVHFDNLEMLSFEI
jgi:hypothetical protein